MNWVRQNILKYDYYLFILNFYSIEKFIYVFMINFGHIFIKYKIVKSVCISILLLNPNKSPDRVK